VKNTFQAKDILPFSQGICGPTQVDQQVKKTFQVKEIFTFLPGNLWADAGWPALKVRSREGWQVKSTFQVKENFTFFRGNPWADAGWPTSEKYVPGKGLPFSQGIRGPTQVDQQVKNPRLELAKDVDGLLQSR
jgi:hypothetical protein